MRDMPNGGLAQKPRYVVSPPPTVKEKTNKGKKNAARLGTGYCAQAGEKSLLFPLFHVVHFFFLSLQDK